jgi:hypothetical protein
MSIFGERQEEQTWTNSTASTTSAVSVKQTKHLIRDSFDSFNIYNKERLYFREKGNPPLKTQFIFLNNYVYIEKILLFRRGDFPFP